jgi:phosphate transport system permease protein
MNRQVSERIALGAITATAVVVILPIVMVVLFIVVQGIGTVNWEFLTQPPRNGMTEGGIFPALLGTILLTFGTAIAAMPIAIGAAIYWPNTPETTASPG